jgi:acid phosphatase class B
VSRSKLKSGQSYLELVQQDTVQKVHDIITTGSLIGSRPMTESDISEGVRFGSIEQLRGEKAQVPAPVAEAEREIIERLRENRGT